MKILVIIRTYPADDYISLLCYNSWKKCLPDATYIFFAQREEDPPVGEYKYIVRTGAQILRRPYCCNFGGMSHVKAYVEGLKQIDVSGFDKIALSDADIQLVKNPFEIEFDYAGIKHVDDSTLYSGQLLMMSKEIFEFIVDYPVYDDLFEHFLKIKRSISDDTIFGWLASGITKNTYDFYDKNYWRHEKLHHLQPLD